MLLTSPGLSLRACVKLSRQRSSGSSRSLFPVRGFMCRVDDQPSRDTNQVNNYLHPLPGASINSSAFPPLLEYCTREKALLLGMIIHSHIVECGLQHITFIANFLLQLYSKCEAIAESLALFVAIYHRNQFSWNLIIRACARLRESKEALQSFERMQEEAVLPSKVTFISILDACATEALLTLAHQVHVRIANTDFDEDVIWSTALVNLYGKCHSLNCASTVFGKMEEKNVVSWTAMISACEQNGCGRVARHCFRQMQQEATLPNQHTFVSVLASCAGDVALGVGKQVHTCLNINGSDQNTVIGSALISMYNKCDSLALAEMVFDQMMIRNVVAWTAMIEAYSQHGREKLAFSLFKQMKKDGIEPNKMTFIAILDACASPEMLDKGMNLHDCIRRCGYENDVSVGTALMNMYARCGSLEAAEAMFILLPKWDVVAWNSMIGAYAVLGMLDKCLEMFDLMQCENIKPNMVTFLNTLVSCANQSTTLNEGKELHSCIIESELDSITAIGNSLVSVYGKCASLKDAQQVFDRISERNVFSWSCIICAHAHHGFGKRALSLFAQMQEDGVRPNKVTFVSVLAACSQSGLLEEAYNFFVSMKPDYGISPVLDHYVCMVDILGKAGQLDDAEALLRNMPFQPALVPFSTLFCACRCHSNPEQGGRAARSLLEMDDDNTVPYLMLAYIYVTIGRGDDARILLSGMRKRFKQVSWGA